MSRQAQTKIGHDHQDSIAKGNQRNNIHMQWSKCLNHETTGDKNE